MREILLSQHKVTLVDDADYEYLSQWKWHAHLADGNFYAARNVRMDTPSGKGLVKMHVAIMQPPEGAYIDHRNGDSLDNRRGNLRLATNAQNGMNRGMQSNNTTGYKGVVLHKPSGRYRVMLSANKRKVHVGYFDDITDAARAYNEAALLHHGEFARLNRIEPE